jgi:DNA-binding NarL/FixJ family response regulator
MKRVLIVDDDELFRLLIRASLETDESVEVVGEAATGREAVHLAGRLLPDIVVMDYAMPVMNGLTASRLIERLWPWIRVVMLTGSVLDEAERADLASHVALLLSKESFEPNSFLHAVLENRAARGTSVAGS